MKLDFQGSNISDVMLNIVKEFHFNSATEAFGLSIEVKGFDSQGDVIENNFIRNKFDNFLQHKSLQPIRTVANTIFPENLWNKRLERKILYNRYNLIIPKLLKCPKNRLGLYFNRMINYPGGSGNINQLEEIISYYKSGTRRRSAFQISIWSPEHDLKNVPQRGFPCLQHIVFAPNKNKLVSFAFYASQYLFERAYGNALGICNLSKFVAHELGIELNSVKIFVGIEKLNMPMKDVSQFLKLIKTEESCEN